METNHNQRKHIVYLIKSNGTEEYLTIKIVIVLTHPLSDNQYDVRTLQTPASLGKCIVTYTLRESNTNLTKI